MTEPDYVQLQEELKQLPYKRDAVEFLCHNFPHLPKSFFNRRLPQIVSLSEADFYRVMTANDPTGERAANRVKGIEHVETP